MGMKTTIQLLNELYELGRKVGKNEEYIWEHETREDSNNEMWNNMVKPLIEQKEKLLAKIIEGNY